MKKLIAILVIISFGLVACPAEKQKTEDPGKVTEPAEAKADEVKKDESKPVEKKEEAKPVEKKVEKKAEPKKEAPKAEPKKEEKKEEKPAK